MSFKFKDEQLIRYGRQISLPQIGKSGQERLLKAKILIIGLGGLGSPAALYLASCGIGTIGLADSDVVDLSNLHRQVIYSTDDVGRPKVDLAKKRLSALNPDVAVITYKTRIISHNIKDIAKDYDLIVDCSDNFATKYLINDTCLLLKKPFIHGGIFKFEGHVATIIPKKGPCYRCLFPLPPDEPLESLQRGLLGIVPAVIGTIQANEALKYILGIGDLLIGRLLAFDALKGSFKTSGFKRRRDCLICGGDK